MFDSFPPGDLSVAQRDGITAVVALVLAVGAGIVFQRVLFAILIRLARKRELVFGAIVRRAQRPAAFIFPLLAVLAVSPNLRLPEAWVTLVEHVTLVATIAATAWGIVALVMLAADYTKSVHRGRGESNLRFRQIETRVDILGRVLVTLVTIVAAAAALMTFPAVRALGATILASAGVAGLVVGLAMRPLLENLVAGVQIALTQPIRLDDVVIVETQTGRIEEITATYVVVAFWDRRRMILPLTYFIDKPFENLTRNSTDLTGAVLLYVDFAMPVEALRSELDRVLADSPLWDGSANAVHVTDASVNGMEIRITLSARDHAALFQLRCDVRERLIAFIAQYHPAALPTLRLDASTLPSTTVLATMARNAPP